VSKTGVSFCGVLKRLSSSCKNTAKQVNNYEQNIQAVAEVKPNAGNPDPRDCGLITLISQYGSSPEEANGFAP